MVKTSKTAKTRKASKSVKKTEQESGLSVSVLGPDGKSLGRLTLPEELFGVKPNKALMAQATRVYLANQREGSANAKTRGEVEGSTRKIYRQKGTGKARHGSIRAPIFVGGGVVFGPVAHDFTMEIPSKMKRKALACALSSHLKEGRIVVVDGLSDIEKTQAMARALAAVNAVGRVLLVLSEKPGTAARSARNIANLDSVPASALHTYAVLSHQKVVFMKDAIDALKGKKR